MSYHKKTQSVSDIQNPISDFRRFCASKKKILFRYTPDKHIVLFVNFKFITLDNSLKYMAFVTMMPENLN